MRTGLDVFLTDGAPRAAGRSAGLITNHTGVDAHLRSTIDLLQASDQVDLVALFAPEHGLWGEAQAGVPVSERVDARTGLPIYSLYGASSTPPPGLLDKLEMLIFDIQDLGARYATRLSIMANAQEAAADAGIDIIILDRPNPIGGDHMEGDLLDPGFVSLVGCHPIPVRHGMTMGELARLFATERQWRDPVVVSMQGWSRTHWFDETGLPWVPPSPNLPTLDSLVLYPGTCLLEGTNLSEGRGTTRPFEIVGAPWLDPFLLAGEMESRHLPGVAFRPTSFTPTFSKHAGLSCGGVQVHLLEPGAVRPVELGLHLLHAMRTLHEEAFAWRHGRDGRFTIDLLYGSDRLRQAIDEGAEVSELIAGWAKPVRDFHDRRKSYLLYS